MKRISTINALFCAVLMSVFMLSCDSDPTFHEEILHFAPYYAEAEYDVLSQDLDLPKLPHAYGNFASTSSFVNNAKGTLGRVLFYDKDLSKDHSVSCASCHDQKLGFADNKAFSVGVSNNKTDRNSLGLGAFNNFQAHYDDPSVDARFFWDERANSLEEQMAETIPNEKEMGLSLDEMEQRVAQKEYYKILYQKAFGNKEIDHHNLREAIAVFVNSITVDQTPFNEGLRANRSLETDFENFTVEENRGKQLFVAQCSSCHGVSLTAGTSFFVESKAVANNGLEMQYTDNGMGNISNLPEHDGVFKVPGLKNIALTAPYMHDGRFATLEEVIDFYSNGIQPHANLDELLKDADGQALKMNFSEEDKAALMAFMNTLTDESAKTEVKWSDPFK